MSLVLTVARPVRLRPKRTTPHCLPSPTTSPKRSTPPTKPGRRSPICIFPQHRPTADLDIVRLTRDLIDESCPTLIQLCTGVGLDVPFAEREAWVEFTPRMATLNPCSMSFGAVEFRNPPTEDVARLAERWRELA